MCASRFSGCPDTGAHNELGHLQANFHTCSCACCHPDFSTGAAEACTEFTYFNFYADTMAHCTPDMCSSRFSGCPDSGEHNELGFVEALWHDEIAVMQAAASARWPGPVGTSCECECCHPDFSTGAAEQCFTYNYFYFDADTVAHCTPAMCSSLFSGCPDAGAHNELGHLVARYDSRLMAPVQPAPEPPKTVITPDESGGASKAGIIVVVIVVSVLGMVAIGVLVYRCCTRTEAAFSGQGHRKSWHAQQDEFDSVTAVAAEQQMRASLTGADKRQGRDPRGGLDRQSDSPAVDEVDTATLGA
eukprot:SAG31_NODE_173_length_21354_cov_16.826112_16_plen_302_part_00